MKRRNKSVYLVWYFLVMAIFLVTGCGGGGGGGGAMAPGYTISGTVDGANDVAVHLVKASTGETTTATTSADFSFKGLSNGTYTVTPVKEGYYFNPVSAVVVVSGANVTGANFTAYAAGSSIHSLSGTITGSVRQGVRMTLNGTADAAAAFGRSRTGGGTALTGTVVTDSNGRYSFSGIPGGNYTVTPFLSGYDFTPPAAPVSISGSDASGIDFTSAPTPEPTYSISGRVSGDTVQDVTIQMTGAATASTVTDADGNYIFSGLYNGRYTITPSKNGFAFSPTSTAVNLNGANQTGKNFTATKIPAKYAISGTVSEGAAGAGFTRLNQVQGVEGVLMTLSGDAAGTTTTNASGNYSFSGIVEGSRYTVTPSAAGYTFNPESLSGTVVGDAAGVDFTAIAKPSVTWKEFSLTTSAAATAGWRRRTLKFEDANPGILFAASSCLNSSGSTACPAAGSLSWAQNAAVITESGSAADKNVHMTVTSSGNFIAGTGNSAGGSYSQLRIALKVLPGALYAGADLQSKTFVFHELVVGSATKWRWGSGYTDAAGAVTLTSLFEPSGAAAPEAWGNLNVNTNGTVTISGIATFSGFLAGDKKTVVGTYTSGTTYRLMILQVTARNDYPAGPLPASVWKSSFLAKSTSIPLVGVQAGWISCTNTVDADGNMTFGEDWTSDNNQFSSNRPTDAFRGTISSSGKVTMADSGYDGQVSDDWNFLVGTMTLEVDIMGSPIYIYLIQVSTR